MTAARNSYGALTLSRRFAPPSPKGRGTILKSFPLPLGEGGAKRRVRVEGLPPSISLLLYLFAFLGHGLLEVLFVIHQSLHQLLIFQCENLHRKNTRLRR